VLKNHNCQEDRLCAVLEKVRFLASPAYRRQARNDNRRGLFSKVSDAKSAQNLFDEAVQVMEAGG
jgi:hypothetical protein